MGSLRKKKNNIFELLDENDQSLAILLNRKDIERPSEAQPQKPAAKQNTVKTPEVSNKLAPKSFSLKNALKDKPSNSNSITNLSENADLSTELDDTDEQNNTAETNSTFSEIELETQWQKFIDNYLPQKPAYASLLTNYIPSINQNFVLRVELEAQLQVDMFNEIKAELVHHLRRSLDNQMITIETSVQTQKKNTNKLYTMEDRFKFLSDKNPSLIKLKQQLNLDFE